MDKLTKQQLSGISELVHHIRNKEVIQCILETLGRDNWNRDILSNCVRYLNDEQDNVFESLGGGYSSEEIDEILYNDDLNFEISEQLKEMGVNRYLYENEEYSLGNITELSLNEIWNSPKALSLFSPEQNETSTNSPCHTCKAFDECKKKIDKRSTNLV